MTQAPTGLASAAAWATWSARLALVALLFNASDPVRMAAAVLLLCVLLSFQRAVLAWDQRQRAATALGSSA